MRSISAIALALGLVCAAPTLQARDWATIKQTGTLIAATEGAYPPFNYFQGGKLTGYEVDVMEAIAKKLNLKLDWRTLGFDAQVAAIAQDRFDVAIASHGITEERQKSVDFTLPHYCSGGQIVAKPGGPLKAAELQGKTLGVQLATTYADAARKVSGAKEVKTYPKDTDAQQALLGGRIDAWVTDRFVAQTAVQKSGNKLKSGELLFVERVAMILRKGNPELLGQLNQTLKDLNSDGTLKRISEKYFKEDVTCLN
ncbi:MAG: amino acid ABC transporter substrate-binding protein [Candidatus Dactylopiibacterium carminicum]|uniref:Amino acid ABC transporter substrate-binding protein n=1 Tax=Candidatus Dactylopiibacterium carminicum TaxID=857335 RepID=A0A272ETL0_9RHOO|nr:ABC transporter substrate-binding protein [Candidatus Dactylopiibacterium carminicum]KAF7599403.1 amino acid ABC transporter substrate-binding protein [Candidatus Dactylopiibacterium carminicum]PAS93439.1 MAG: amino acid ABC transporter substrate-binding protein [Candidatus Dactylopiibacterium carminicum]PAS95958.1 MAG: amino acid ABC transporter substrate-binding protein [Candidatus Dactylopiibacterium carminicum]PAS99413.1 MAG: amino acid ABC transporter substrate-binding protein [Candidat